MVKSRWVEKLLTLFSNLFFSFMGLIFSFSAIGILIVGIGRFVDCATSGCDLLVTLLNTASYLIISVAIFDVGRYLLEEEVLRCRELRSLKEARRSLTKFMVIIVIAVTLEALIATIKASTTSIDDLLYPAALFMAATLLLIGLGVYQRLSVMTERDIGETD